MANQTTQGPPANGNVSDDGVGGKVIAIILVVVLFLSYPARLLYRWLCGRRDIDRALQQLKDIEMGSTTAQAPAPEQPATSQIDAEKRPTSLNIPATLKQNNLKFDVMREEYRRRQELHAVTPTGDQPKPAECKPAPAEILKSAVCGQETDVARQTTTPKVDLEPTESTPTAAKIQASETLSKVDKSRHATVESAKSSTCTTPRSATPKNDPKLSEVQRGPPSPQEQTGPMTDVAALNYVWLEGQKSSALSQEEK